MADEVSLLVAMLMAEAAPQSAHPPTPTHPKPPPTNLCHTCSHLPRGRATPVFLFCKGWAQERPALVRSVSREMAEMWRSDSSLPLSPPPTAAAPLALHCKHGMPYRCGLEFAFPISLALKRVTHWIPCRMEEAYEEALQQLGGLEEAKPRDMLEALVSEFPQLTRKVRWFLGCQQASGPASSSS